MGWLNGWKYRIGLTIDQGDIDGEVLSNFPVLIHLSTSSGIGGVDVSCVFDELASDANRKKIAVTTSDGRTQCYVEIEKWDDGGEEAWLWAKVPSVAYDADTSLYLYYDSSKADNATYVGDTNSTPAETVWDSDFKFVSHMRDDPDTSHIRDSTNNNKDGTKVGAGEPVLSSLGETNGAQAFDGDNDYISLPFGTINHGTSDFVLSLWLRVDGGDDTVRSYVRAYGAGADGLIAFALLDDNTLHMWLRDDVDPKESIAANTVETYEAGATPYHVAYVYDDATKTGKIFVNDVEKASDTNLAYGENTTTHGQSFGAAVDWLGQNPVQFSEITLDEVRFSLTLRSSAWRTACYESERDDLITFGAERSQVIGPVPTHFNV